jgi:hypothetical protein
MYVRVYYFGLCTLHPALRKRLHTVIPWLYKRKIMVFRFARCKSTSVRESPWIHLRFGILICFEAHPCDMNLFMWRVNEGIYLCNFTGNFLSSDSGSLSSELTLLLNKKLFNGQAKVNTLITFQVTVVFNGLQAIKFVSTLCLMLQVQNFPLNLSEICT